MNLSPLNMFVRLSTIKSFTPKEYKGKAFKKWDMEQKKMLISPSYQEGFRMMYTFETDQGTLDLSSSQLGTLLASMYPNPILNQLFEVKTNGKTGLEIRYFFRPIFGSKAAAIVKAAEKSEIIF